MINRQAAFTSATLVVVMLAAALWALGHVPEGTRVPIHYGIDGTPDGWTSAPVGLFFFPVLGALTWCVFAVLPLIDPRQENLRRSARAYGAGWVALTVVFAAIQGITIIYALGWEFNIARAIPLLVGALLIAIGNILGKIRPNFSMGIRTRWTLADEEVWDKTHRFGGKTFVLGGAAIMLATLTLTDPALFAGIIIAVIAGITLLPVLKSYLLWRNRTSG